MAIYFYFRPNAKQINHNLLVNWAAIMMFAFCFWNFIEFQGQVTCFWVSERLGPLNVTYIVKIEAFLLYLKLDERYEKM